MPDDPHVLDSLPAYALGALEADEARRVAEHLAGCSTCQESLREFQAVADRLALMTPEVRPPADLKPRLMKRIRGESRAPAPSARWRLRLPALRPAGVVAGLVLMLALAVSTLLLWQRLNTQEVLSGPLGMRAIALENRPTAAAGASGFVVLSADGQDGALVVDGLPALDPQHEYQLWLVRGDESTSGAVFSVDESGYRGTRVEAPESLLSYDAVRVTVEPAGGSASPSGEEVLGGSLFNP